MEEYIIGHKMECRYTIEYMIERNTESRILGCELPGKTLPARVGYYPVIGNYQVITR